VSRLHWNHLVPALALAGASALLAAPSADAKPPRGYTVVSSGDIVAVPGTQSFGSVGCPAGLVPLGGAATIHSVSIAPTISSSFPFEDGWAAFINNPGSSPVTFEVTAACARQPKRYTIVTGPVVQNPSGSQSGAFVSCPMGSKPLSGGVEASSDSLSVNMNTSIPDGRSWEALENNSGGDANAIEAVAVCGMIPGYAVVQSALATNAAGSHTLTFAECPGSTASIGGGAFSSSPAGAVDAGGMGFDASAFISSMNNGSDTDYLSSTFAICAGR
jgi:hypothetical protein